MGAIEAKNKKKQENKKQNKRNMVNTNTFIKWLIFMGVTLRAAQSAIPQAYRMAEQCHRIANELDENTIVQAQKGCHSRKLDDYYQDRQDILNYEMNTSFGSDIKLNEMENAANKIVMAAKESEYRAGFQNPYIFEPSRHVFEVLDEIQQSKLFQILKKMPKGGILHSHDTAICSANYVVSLTYWEDLWQRTENGTNKIVEFRFSRDQPKSMAEDDTGTWRLVKDVRAEVGALTYDQQIRAMFTLFDKNVHPKVQFKDVNDVWDRFMGIFILNGPIITYAPAWKAYYKNALKEMQEDGVQYLELRSTLPKVYILT